MSVAGERDDDILQGYIFEKSDDEEERGYSLDITNDEIDITAGGTDGAAATDAYTITLKERNDNKKTYTLCDNMLIDCEKGIQYSLTKKQLEELKNALGI